MNFEFADNADLQFTKENLEDLFKEDDSGILEDDADFLLRLGMTYSHNTLMYILIERNMEKGDQTIAGAVGMMKYCRDQYYYQPPAWPA